MSYRSALVRLLGHPLLPRAVLVIGLGATGITGWLHHRAAQEALGSRFNARAAEIRAAADNRIARIDEMLRSLSAYASTDPTHGQWLAFMAKVQPGRNLAEVRSVTYIAHVYNLDKYAFSKEPKRRAAMDYAWQSAKIGLTGVLPLAADNGSPRANGVIAYHAVFRHDLPARTPRERIRAVTGYVSALLDAHVFLEGLMRDDDDGYAIRLRDLADGKGASSVLTAARKQRSDSPEPASARTDWRWRQSIEIGGHPWELEVSASREAVSRNAAGLLDTPLIVVGGILLSLMCALAIGSLVSTQRRAQERAGTMTALLRERDSLLSARKDAERALRASEMQLREHHDLLQRTVEERTRDLATALIRAETASRAKSEFLANMSQELRTPLHAVLSDAKLGAEKSAASRPQATRLSQYFARIQASGERLLALLNDLLDLSRLEAGKMPYAMAEHDLAAALEEALPEFAEPARAKSVRIRIDPVPAQTRAWFDPARIGQVLRNLLSNAIKFSSEGGEIRIAFASGMLPAGQDAGDTAAAITLTISDGGPGIPPGELETVFDEFVQSSKTRTGAGGTGLGLSICREIVAAHGGRIHAFNNAGGGASLSFSLPVKAAQPSDASNDRRVHEEQAA